MIHPDTIIARISPEKGCGVIAGAPIPAGTVTWVADELDHRIAPNRMNRLHPLLRESAMTYCFRNRAGHYILCWDHARYMNHSFQPNCMPTPYGFEIAIRDIQPGDELTNDYGTLNIIEPFRPLDEGTPRKDVCPDDLATHYQLWDQQWQKAFEQLATVDQPLRGLIDPVVWNDCLQRAEKRKPHDSIHTLLLTK